MSRLDWIRMQHVSPLQGDSVVRRAQPCELCTIEGEMRKPILPYPVGGGPGKEVRYVAT